ncbi:hypothetical protein [Nostoc sp. DedQUE09]|uniref:hypothetical protein n=1 Tax=Nostoc sp. DedQUE09 TaxID=3075394 RepID=UPI002AD2F6B8|nr:hypothetical protein [Nostoc sp. DedQUE09]MDZ7953339.1 hypothetical protein [Nostoc sp. DedQUE09]MDZ7953367.1 hypothetical protein [Nostoc sp. DedQUE09]
MEPTLTAVFGANATQDADTLTISKADLTSTGLTPGANNTAESLLIALMLKFKAALTDAGKDTNIDQSVAVVDGFSPSITTRNDAIYLRNTISVEIDRVLTGAATIDPNLY